ncbi:unnamed protein product [Sphagnum balticum]
MFRKRAAPRKAVNLNEELTEIECSKQVELPGGGVRGRIDHLVQLTSESERIQSACLDGMFVQEDQFHRSSTSSYLEELRQ